jgi:hypothetical protein
MRIKFAYRLVSYIVPKMCSKYKIMYPALKSLCCVSGVEGQEHLPGLDHTQPLVQPYPPPAAVPSQRAASEGQVAGELVPSETT